MRSTINLLAPNEHMTALRSLKKRLFRVALRYHYATVSPEGLGEFRDFYAAASKSVVSRSFSIWN